MGRVGLIAAALLALAGPVAAGDVISAAPTSAAVTIYQDAEVRDPAEADWDGDGLAMITETRVVDLPAGVSRVVFEGVSDGALPQTAAIEGLPGKIKEQNFDYDLLSPGSLIDHSLGRPVQLVRVNRKTGKQTLEGAVLRSGPGGVVVDVGGHLEAIGCGGEIQGLVFQGVPTELTGKAALSTSIRVDQSGRYTLHLAYLTVGLAWQANYVAALSPDDAKLDLTGWITLANHSNTSFANAPTSVVAGRLARQDVEKIEAILAQRTLECWPQGNSHHPVGQPYYLAEAERLRGVMAGMALPAPAPPPMARAMSAGVVTELVVTAEKRTTQSELGDYKLYSLVEPTTVAAQQTKQVSFLHQKAVSFDQVYVYRVGQGASAGEDTEGGPATITLRFENKPEKGLGEALPGGKVSVRLNAPGIGARLIGEPGMRDVPVGEPFELTMGDAADVQAKLHTTDDTSFHENGRDGERTTIEATVTNAKNHPVTAEIRQPVQNDAFKVISETSAHGTKAGDPVWRMTVPANGSASVTYAVQWLN